MKVTLKDFQKLDLRVGKITSIKDHPDADKLYILLVDLGTGEHDLQLVAGIAKHYNKVDLLGKEVIVIANLEPAVIRGIESQGMLLAAEFQDTVTLLTPDHTIEVGAKIR